MPITDILIINGYIYNIFFNIFSLIIPTVIKALINVQWHGHYMWHGGDVCSRAMSFEGNNMRAVI